jgi:hypothetical protein
VGEAGWNAGNKSMGNFDVESRLTVSEEEMRKEMDMTMCYYDDDSPPDVEAEKGRGDMGLASMADVQILTLVKTGGPRVVEYTRL